MNTGKGTPFERIRRITGYLGTLDRFNNAKLAEERERVKHTLVKEEPYEDVPAV